MPDKKSVFVNVIYLIRDIHIIFWLNFNHTNFPLLGSLSLFEMQIKRKNDQTLTIVSLKYQILKYVSLKCSMLLS